MTQTLAHRGPDASGLWQEPEFSLVLGHQRLSIIDLSDEGHQPMVSASERYVITYNGELYNFPALQKDLEQAGVTFRGRSDTEILLAAVDYWGLNIALQKFNGMFAFALWDRKLRQLHLVRDRLGKKPLYVGWAGKSLVFGSELKALRAHKDFIPVLNRDVLALYMRRGYVAAPHCIYKNVWALPAGFRLTLNLSSLKTGADLYTEMKPYWQHLLALQESQARARPTSDGEAVRDFEALLTSCVADRMVSDVPLGAFLSGGIDSSTIVALMQGLSGQRVQTFSIGFEEAGYNEAVYAKAVAEHLNTEHHELYLSGQEALDIIPQMPDIYDEPFADASAIPTYLVSKFVRGHVSVALSGDGGDEMLGGYNRHFMGPRIWNRMRYVPRPLRTLIAGGLYKIPVERWDSILNNQPQAGIRMHKLASILSLGTREDIYERLTTRWDENPVINASPIGLLQDDPQWNPAGTNLSFAERMMYWDTLDYLPNGVLTKVDRASMAVGLEVRAPLLDKRIYDYVWSLPESYKIKNTPSGLKGKWLLRQVLHRHVPEKLFERPKQGFTIPVDQWLRGPLKDWAENLLNAQMLEHDGLIDAPVVRALWDAHQRGEGNHSAALWNILMFQAWKDRWV